MPTQSATHSFLIECFVTPDNILRINIDMYIYIDYENLFQTVELLTNDI